MSVLVDTSILVRLANVSDVFYGVATSAVFELHRRQEALSIAPQNLIEFRSVATRPTAVNGLGLSAADAERIAESFEKMFTLLEESPAIFPAWKALVAAAGTLGKQVHDARLAAVCQVNHVTHILTFNSGHFTAFAACVTAMDPGKV